MVTDTHETCMYDVLSEAKTNSLGTCHMINQPGTSFKVKPCKTSVAQYYETFRNFL